MAGDSAFRHGRDLAGCGGIDDAEVTGSLIGDEQRSVYKGLRLRAGVHGWKSDANDKRQKAEQRGLHHVEQSICA
jgi:hypothetical protein